MQQTYGQGFFISIADKLSKLNSDSQWLHSKKGLELSNLAIKRLKFSGIFQKLTLMWDLSQLLAFFNGYERDEVTKPKVFRPGPFIEP